MENIYWKKTVGTLIGAIWLYTLADIAASITGAVNEILNPSGTLGMIKDLMEGGSGAPSLSMGDIIESMFSILVLVGYYLFFHSLARFSRLQSNKQDGEYVSTVRTAYILLVVALIVDFIPFIGWLASFVIMVIAYIKMLSGYRGLKKSTTFPAEACQGATTLYSCTIWTLVGYVLGCIPLIGSVIEGIITLVVFFTILSAWGRIKNGAPELTPEEEEAFKRDEVPAYKQILGDALIVYFFIVAANIIFDMLYQEDFLGYRLFWWLAVMAIYVWLLCASKAQFGMCTKSGLYILLLYALGSIFIMIQNSHFTELDIILEGAGSMTLLWDILGVLSVIGAILFIWSSRANLRIKIIFSLYPLLSQLYWRVIWRYEFTKIAYTHTGDYKALASLNTIFQIIWLTIIIIFFVLVYYFVSQWKKQSTVIDVSNI